MMRIFLLIAAGFIALGLLISSLIIPEVRERNRVRLEQQTWCTQHGFDNANVTETRGSGKNSYTLNQVLCMDKDRRLVMPE